MSARASGAMLEQALKDILVEWQQCRASWNDVKAREFEHDFLSFFVVSFLKKKFYLFIFVTINKPFPFMSISYIASKRKPRLYIRPFIRNNPFSFIKI